MCGAEVASDEWGRYMCLMDFENVMEGEADRVLGAVGNE
jgi:hypothetical protein